MMGKKMFAQMEPLGAYARLVGLIGWPAAFWPAPEIYNAAFQALHINWRCVTLPVSMVQLHDALLGLRALGFAGAEVAQPYQGEVLKYLAEISPAAKTIEAVKVIEVDDDGCLVGDNLHWLGFMRPLRAMVPSLDGLRPLIIGASNSARSIVYALTREGLPVTIVDEHVERAIDLVHRLRHVLDEHSFSVYRWPQDLDRVAGDANLIVNATDIGAWPDVDRSPWPDALRFPPDAVVFDLVSWPCETRFLRRARASGCATVSGLSLSVCEAAMAFERWTGHSPPIEVMWRTAVEVLVQKTRGELPSRSDGQQRCGSREPASDRRSPKGQNSLRFALSPLKDLLTTG